MAKLHLFAKKIYNKILQNGQVINVNANMHYKQDNVKDGYNFFLIHIKN